MIKTAEEIEKLILDAYEKTGLEPQRFQGNVVNNCGCAIVAIAISNGLNRDSSWYQILKFVTNMNKFSPLTLACGFDTYNETCCNSLTNIPSYVGARRAARKLFGLPQDI